MADVITEAKRLRAQVLKRDAAEIKRVIAQYKTLYDRLKGDIVALQAAIDKNPGMTAAQLKRLSDYKRLLSDIQREMDDYSAWLRGEVRAIGNAAVTNGIKDARALLVAQDPRILAVYRSLPAAQVEMLMGFLSPSGELYKRLSGMGDYFRQRIADALIEGMARGLNPKTIAADIVRRELGMGLTDAMRTARTVQLWAYREASRASYIANGDVVEGWVWMAELDDSTCPACIAMNGTIHSNDEPLDGHFNCRCTPVPLVVGAESGIKSGEDWFAGLSEDKQREILGAGRYEAWKDGKFEFSALAGQREDDVYGTMRVQTPLKDLLGE